MQDDLEESEVLQGTNDEFQQKCYQCKQRPVPAHRCTSKQGSRQNQVSAISRISTVRQSTVWDINEKEKKKENNNNKIKLMKYIGQIIIPIVATIFIFSYFLVGFVHSNNN